MTTIKLYQKFIKLTGELNFGKLLFVCLNFQSLNRYL